ncbi:hypothetical protein LEP1GSC125_1095 [Leptospira mayottensis 200901122]|uniref:Uncharacterized protein n=1 Tax=Leptospira mayottensis 200901122 TaxID=1193010 RepID=A0AA87MM41_9LEPT|nr:hypothetical protein LEP1GSC125_1095 [Leptospira mayottensis 200901122]
MTDLFLYLNLHSKKARRVKIKVVTLGSKIPGWTLFFKLDETFSVIEMDRKTFF